MLYVFSLFFNNFTSAFFFAENSLCTCQILDSAKRINTPDIERNKLSP